MSVLLLAKFGLRLPHDHPPEATTTRDWVSKRRACCKVTEPGAVASFDRARFWFKSTWEQRPVPCTASKVRLVALALAFSPSPEAICWQDAFPRSQRSRYGLKALRFVRLSQRRTSMEMPKRSFPTSFYVTDFRLPSFRVRASSDPTVLYISAVDNI